MTDVNPDPEPASPRTRWWPPAKFDRNELAGAFGGIGTDLPLLTAMILAGGLNSASVFTVFGFFQVLSGLLYGIPMPVQPLKAVAAIVIAQKLSGPILFGGGLSIGIVMLILTMTGVADWIARVTPKAVVRGMQFGLGLMLCQLALKNYVVSEGVKGAALAGAGFVITLCLLGHRKYPAALLVILLGILYAFFFPISDGPPFHGFGFSAPRFHVPAVQDIVQGFLLLGLAQIPLSLANSVVATRQVAQDFFPEKHMTARKIGFTYSVMNLLAPFLSGVPVCHGSGGMVGHHLFGARTGGSVILYGAIYLLIGMFFSLSGTGGVIHLFPLPILGVLLFFEGLALLRLVADVADSKAQLSIVFLVGTLSAGLPYGFAIGMAVGTGLARLSARYPSGFTGIQGTGRN